MDNFWQGKRVLITGGTGFLGRHLTEGLLKAGAIVQIVDCRQPIQEIPGVNFVQADIRDKDKIERIFGENIDAVFHLAAIPSIARAKRENYYAINVAGTENILHSACLKGVKKIVYVSSSTVYGMPACLPLREGSPLKPIGKYGRSKLEAENACRRFIDKGLDISIIRPRVIIGPGRIGIFSILFNQVAKGGNVYILGKGNNIFQFTHVKDMSDACMRAAESKGADLFNIGSDEVRPVREELAVLIKHARSKSRIISVPAAPARFLLVALNILNLSPLVNEQFMIADKDFKLDTAYARRKLNWSARYSNLDSLVEAYDWYISHINKMPRQYKNIFGICGKFKHSHMGGFQS